MVKTLSSYSCYLMIYGARNCSILYNELPVLLGFTMELPQRNLPEALRGLRAPETWPEVIRLLLAHEEQVHGTPDVVNGFIRMHEIMAEAKDDSLLCAMASPDTGDYPTFDGALQTPAY